MTTHSRRLLWLLVLAVLLGGCVAAPPQPDTAEFAPVYPPAPPSLRPSGGSLYTDAGIDLFTDNRAMRVGDILTVRLEERTQASKSADTSLSKETEQSLEEPTIFSSMITGVADNLGLTNSLGSSSEFSGSADSGQSNSLSGTISVLIAAVHPNGLLEVKGEKWLQLNQGEEYIRIAGFVRREDVAVDNSISSTKLANARIAYGGTGTLAETNQPGWLARFFNGPLMPW